jgi:hypothetical protein
MDYCLDTINDLTFGGLAVGCEEVCNGQRLEPVRCVTFEGTNMGRHFYKYPVLNVSQSLTIV